MPPEVVEMDVSSTAAKRAAETTLEKGRGRSPRGNFGSSSSDLLRIKSESEARTQAARAQAQEGRDELAHLKHELSNALL
jgi:hypothetical protein